VVERGEYLPLAPEASREFGVGEAAADDLERDLLPELAVGAFGEEDRAHPPAPYLADDAVGSDLLPLDDVRAVVPARQPLGGQRERRHLDEVPYAVAVAEQRLDLCAQRRVAGAGRVEHRRLLPRPARQRRLHQLVHPPQTLYLRRHFKHPRPSRPRR
jgi:hypothetical protein